MEQKGFTLLELLLYISISSLILLVATLFLGTLLESREKNSTIMEVESQGAQVLYTIIQVVRNAESITTPAVGASTGTITLDVVEAGDDPTVFDLASGTIRMTEGASDPVSLTNSLVEVTDLTFSNVSRSSTPGVVQIEFTISYVNNTGRQEHEYQKTFTGTASLRHP